VLNNEDVLNEDDFHVPDEFRCCITTDVMSQPYVAVDGHSYELDAIVQWLKRSNVSPKTGDPIPARLVPNAALKTLIDEWPVICERVAAHHAAKTPQDEAAEKVRVLSASLSAREMDLAEAKAAARELRRSNDELRAALDEERARSRRLAALLEQIHALTRL
jgi:hypothetical protein